MTDLCLNEIRQPRRFPQPRACSNFWERCIVVVMFCWPHLHFSSCTILCGVTWSQIIVNVADIHTGIDSLVEENLGFFREDECLPQHHSTVKAWLVPPGWDLVCARFFRLQPLLSGQQWLCYCWITIVHQEAVTHFPFPIPLSITSSAPGRWPGMVSWSLTLVQGWACAPVRSTLRLLFELSEERHILFSIESWRYKRKVFL